MATIYERYGSRLLEQNVRSFLQFTGKINNGIRKTIKEEPEMFLAFNNGIAATAEEVSIDKSEDGKGFLISKVKDFQIVNGGQTTASIYHTLKKDKANISKIFVQVKLSVVKNKNNFSQIVSRIAEYANTQNKVSVSDLSSNKPYHIELEKLSRTIFSPHVVNQASQTKWFYERARGQYKNARSKEGFTKTRQKAFDLKNPKNQMFTKEDLAKYINAYQEIYDGKKLVIGPHIVVRGSQKNYVQFINYNLVKKSDSIYFEDIIAKAIIFRTAEKIYGIKPNAIGDLRYITVPYSLSLLNFETKNKLDLHKIWKNQGISEDLRNVLYDLMGKVETAIKKSAESNHGALYGEWAKKVECWNDLKKQKFDIDFNSLNSDLEDLKNPTKRKRLADEETEEKIIKAELERIRSIPAKIWYKIEDWGRATGLLNEQKKTVAYTIAGRIRSNTSISEYERRIGNEIIDLVIKDSSELLSELEETKNNEQIQPEITLDIVKKIARWDRKNKYLKDFEYKFMEELADGVRPWTEQSRKIATINYVKAKKLGFIH